MSRINAAVYSNSRCTDMIKQDITVKTTTIKQWLFGGD